MIFPFIPLIMDKQGGGCFRPMPYGKDMIIISIDGGQKAIDVLKEGKINCVVECTPKLGKELMETALKLKAGEAVEPVIHPTEQVFSDEQGPNGIAPRGY